MFCFYRSLFFAIMLLTCVVIAAPVLDVEPQRVLSIVDQERADGSGVVGRVLLQTTAEPTGEESVGARVL
jgi:hypothetical protein